MINPHFHYHLCVLDGVYEAADEEEGEHSSSRTVRFHEATALTRADVEALQETVRLRILRDHASRGARRRQGLLEEHTVREMLGWDHAGGFSLDASVRIAAHDRAGLERLLRYCARPPFALNRIEWRDSRGSDGEEVVASAGEVTTLPVPQTTPPRPVSTLSRRRARSHSRRASSRWAALLAGSTTLARWSVPGTARSVVGRARTATRRPSGPGTARTRLRLRRALGRRKGPDPLLVT